MAGADFLLEFLQCLLYVLFHRAGVGKVGGCHKLIQGLGLGQKRQDTHRLEIKAKLQGKDREGWAWKMQEGSYRTGEVLKGVVRCLSSLPPPLGRCKVICSSSNQLVRNTNA